MFGMGKPARAPAATQKVRPPAKPPARAAVTVHLDAGERDKFEQLGGESWLRRQLQHARVPATQE